MMISKKKNKLSLLGLAFPATIAAYAHFSDPPNASGDIESIASMDYIPYPDDGDCISLDLNATKEIRFIGSDTSLLGGLYKTVFKLDPPQHTSSLPQDDTTISLSKFKVAACNTVNSEDVTIFKDRAAAIIHEAKNSQDAANFFQGLYEEYPKMSLLKGMDLIMDPN